MYYKDDECLCRDGYVWGGGLLGCVSVCGDGVKVGGEDCDDGNVVDGDGCSGECRGQLWGYYWGSVVAGVAVVIFVVVGVLFMKTSLAGGGGAGAANVGHGLSSENVIKANDPPFSSF